MKRSLSFALLLFSQLLMAQTLHTVLPSTTDPNITDPDVNHYAYINTDITPKNKLFLFLPGTGASPVHYTFILAGAANLGYHSIGLTYPNAVAINSDSVCGTSTDTTCHSRARHEVFDGIDRISSLNIDTNNCIQNRVLKLLQYLFLHFPSEHWGQYILGDSINWNKIIVSGHSQGGGHAGFISKIKEVDRVVMFCAMDWIILLNRNADWITWPGQTSQNRYFGLAHQRDELLPFAEVQTTWKNFGMFNYGSLVFVDTAITPFANSHTLYTNITPRNDTTQYHGSPVVNYYTPLDAYNVPVLKPVWDYLIDHPINSGVNEPATGSDLFYIFQEPQNERLTIKLTNNQCINDQLQIYNLVGERMKEIEIIQMTQVNISDFSTGLYFIRLKHHPLQIKKFIKF